MPVVIRKIASLGLLLALAAWSGSARASSDSGLAAVLSEAYPLGGLGLGLNYYQRLGERPWFVVPHARVGYYIFDGVGPRWAAGISIARGQTHRGVLVLDYGVTGQYKRYLHGEYLWSKPKLGPQLGLGYELSRGHYLFQVLPTVSYALGLLPPLERRVGFMLSIAAGWKFW